MSKSQFIKLSGLAFIAGSFAFVAMLRGSVASPILSSILLATGMLGLRASYGESVGRFGKNILLIGVVGMVLTYLGIFTLPQIETFRKFDLSNWELLVFAGPAVLLLALTLFGLTALRRKPMFRFNWLPVVSGIWFPVIYFGILPYLFTNNGTLPDQFPWAVIEIPIEIQFLALCLFGFILVTDVLDVEILINRTLVYGTLTASVVGLYVLIVGGLGTLLQTQNDLASIVLTILLIAFLFQPLRRRLQDIVNRFVPVPKVMISESTPSRLPEARQEQKVAILDSAPNTTIRGRWLLIARLVWLAIGMLAMIVYTAAAPVAFHVLATPCNIEPCISPFQPVAESEGLPQEQASLKFGAWYHTILEAVLRLVTLGIALFLFWRRSNDWMALLTSVMLVAIFAIFSPSPMMLETAQPLWHWPVIVLRAIALAATVGLFYLFPDGRFVPRWMRRPAIALLFVIGGFVAAGAPFQAGFPIFVVILVTGAGVQIYRYKRVSDPLQRQQTKWVVFGIAGMVVPMLVFFLFAFLNPSLNPLRSNEPILSPGAIIFTIMVTICVVIPLYFLPVTLAFSVLRYRLWDIDIIINRTLVYGALSAGIVTTYILLVGLLGALFNSHVILAASFLTAALTVPFFQPLRLRLQHAVNRITFGGRDMPSPKQEIEESPPELELQMQQHWPAWLLFDLTCILSAISILLLALSWETPVLETWGFRGDALLFALSFSSIGLLLARRQPQNSIGWLLLIAGLLCAILEFCIEYATYALLTKAGALPYGALAAWNASWLWVIAIALLIYTFLLFPTGHLASTRWRPVAWFTVVAFALTTLTFMMQPGPLYFAPYLDNPFAVQPVYRVLNPLQSTSAVAILLIGLSLILRLRRAEGVERQQLKWFAYAAILITLIGITDSLAGAAGLIGRDPKFYQYLTVAIWIAIPFAIAFAILRYRLWDIDVFINRSLVYGTLIVSVIGLYMIVVGIAGALLQFVGNTFLAILATGLIAVLFHPLQQRLQRGINHLMYGERDNPYAALSRLGRQLEASLAPEAVLPTVVTTVREVLKLPYVAIYLQQDSHGYKIVAESASPALRIENGRIWVPGMEREGLCVPLIHQGETLGYIVLGPRAPNEAFSSMDLRLLDDLAPQVGVAVHAVRLTADLQRSRERLVLAREEERRRLRRDLHDDLGPTLASFGLAASTVADLISKNPTAATKLAKELESQMRATIGHVRRLVYDLRPPTLDELGLLPAVRERATRFSNAPNGFHVTVDAPEELPALPAAVEVAVYRIVQEALENVSKHSQARQCTIRFANHNGLEIEIMDDGIGLSANITPGVGLRSMRERAEELGGSCVIERCVDGGTRILAHLPIGESDGTFAHPDRG